MIENIKENIWAILKKKDISLAMIFNQEGEILWQRGRQILKTKKITQGGGYSSTCILEAIHQQKIYQKEDCLIRQVDGDFSESVRTLNIKSLIIIPLADRYFLYLDSGIRQGFDKSDVATFKTLAAVLGGFIQNLQMGFGIQKKMSGASPPARQVREKIAKYAIEEEPVLILGETGVGKNFIAELIHSSSGRPGKFVVVNAPGIPETLLESQLFGHCKGSFSGAVADHDGFVAVAENGTLFLDEIAELSPALQAKLLRFIDTQLYNRLGDTGEKKANTRILAATNQNLQLAIANKTFRDDLFFRLNCLAIEIPPLRSRKEDIPLLIEEKKDLLRGKQLTGEAMTVLLGYHWPGNVRELIQVLKLTGIHFEGDIIGAEIADLLVFAKNKPAGGGNKIDGIWQKLQSGNDFWETVKKPFLDRDLNRDEVKILLNRGLNETDGRYSSLAKLFHIESDRYKHFMNFLYENKLK